MKTVSLGAVIVTVALARVAPASAQTLAGATSPESSTSVAGTFVMPDITGGTAAGLDVMVGQVTNDGGDVTVMTAELHGRFVITPRLALSARLPWMRASDDRYSESGLGNPTLGVQYTRRSTGSARTITGGIGLDVGVPLADEDLDYGNLFHFDDPLRYFYHTLAVRPHIDGRLDAGRFFAQAQAGVDYYMVLAPVNDPTLTLLHVVAGGGVTLRPGLAAVAELTTLSTILEDSVSPDDFSHAVTAGVRYQARRMAVGARLYLPLDDFPLYDQLYGERIFAVGLDAAGRF